MKKVICMYNCNVFVIDLVAMHVTMTMNININIVSIYCSGFQIIKE